MPKYATFCFLPLLFVLLVGADGCADRCDRAERALERAKAIVTTLEAVDEATPQFDLHKLEEARAVLAQAETLVRVFCPIAGLAASEPTDDEIQGYTKDHKELMKRLRSLERSAGL